MTAPRAIGARLGRARRTLALTVTGRALLLGAAAGLALVALALAVDLLVPLSRALRGAVRVAAGAAALGVALGVLLVQARRVLRAGDEEVALWLEARLPGLRYALVTLAGWGERRADEGTTASHRGATRRALEVAVAEAPLEAEVARGARAALLRPAIAAAVLVALFLVIPGGAVARVAAPTPGDLLARPGAAGRAGADPLAAIVVRVTPPAYSGLPARVLEDPATVTVLAGSRVSIEGLGGAGPDAAVDIHAEVGEARIPATARGGGWQVALAAPPRATAVRLVAAPRSARILVLDPYVDSVPTVRLALPARDSVLRVAAGTVTLSAEVRDDHGLAEGAFEYIVSSGFGENFAFRTGRTGVRRFAAGERAGTLAGTLRLDSLRLAPGDLVHLRAVATDRNDVTGPGIGTSETRTLRIARPDEYDSVAVDPLPPSEPERNALSQRMLLELTRALHARAPRLSRDSLARASRRIAVDQARLRKRVGEVVFLRIGEGEGGEHAHFAGDGHEHGAEGLVDPEAILAAATRAAAEAPTRMLEAEGDESPIVAINRPLLEAYNHMWRAGTELETARPGAAIPWMERAIEALQRARAAERIYLRGRPPRVVVDVAKVRMTGKDKGVPGARRPGAPLDPARAERLARFDAVLARAAADPLAAADTLLLLRVALPEGEEATARTLDAAAAALRRGGEATAPLVAARRALAGDPVRSGPLRRWGS